MNAESDALLVSFATQKLLHNGSFSVLTLFITLKSRGDHATASVISPSLKIMKFQAQANVRRKYCINVENFTRKCQAIIGIDYFNTAV